MPKTLNAWEEYLREFIPHIRLLGEIPLTPTDLVNIEGMIRQEIKIGGLTKATTRLETYWPATFITYLAFKAAFNNEWNFWGNVALGMDRPDKVQFFMEAHHWGKTYLRCLARFGLPTFETMEAGNQYVARIRLHGGVPAYSLPDFFAYILLPSLQKPETMLLQDKPALERLLESSYIRLFVHDTVQQFFKFGGEPALSFFTKCRSMARLALNGKPLPSPTDLGLRPYVLEAFRKYWGRQAAPVSGPTRRRWKEPKIVFSPYHPPSYELSLPEQVIPLEAANRPYAWRLIDPEGGEQSYRVRLSKPQHDVVTSSPKVSIDDPWQQVKVIFTAGGESVPADLKREWSFDLLPAPGQIPLLAFTYHGRKPVSISGSLPAEACWLLFPANARLRFGNTARCLEEVKGYWPPWDSWQTAAYDLGRAEWVQVVLADGAHYAPIPIETRLDEPQLLGENILAASLPVDDKPLNVGLPPVISLPRSPEQSIEQALKRWEILVEARFDADPGGRWGNAELASAAQEAADDPNRILLPLQAILGEHPTGTYHVSCARPGIAPYELPFRICPPLQITGLDPYYIPDPVWGAQPVHFQIHPQPWQQICQAASDTGITVQRLEDGRFDVLVPGEMSQADLQLEHHLPHKRVRLPISLAVPRLRWALRLQPADPVDWQSRPLSRPQAEIQQSSSPALYIELPNNCQEELYLALKLINPDTGEELQTSDTQTLRPNQEHLRFNLKGFEDTLRSIRDLAFAELRLEWLDALSNRDLSIPLLRLTQALNVKVVGVQFQEDGSWIVHWYEPQPLRHRHLYLWSEWQPWADPLDVPIPDNAERSDSEANNDWWMIHIPPEVGMPPPGHYRALFTVVPPWEHSVLPNYAPAEAISIQTKDANIRLREIEADIEKYPGRMFALHFERACVLECMKNTSQKEEEIRWCLSNWRIAPPMYILAFYNWLGLHDENSQRAARMYMYRVASLQNLQAQPKAIIQEYLVPFPLAQTVSPTAALMVLRLSNDPAVISRALEILLKSSPSLPQAIEYIVDEMEANRFADQDALDLLNPYEGKAIETLINCAASPSRDRLLVELTRQTPQPELLIFAGYWIRSGAGWGLIELIRSEPGGEEKIFFLPGHEKPFLEVTLRPDKAPESVTFNLATNQMNFLGKDQLFLCTKCGQFISGDYNRLKKEHTSTAHYGMGLAFSPSTNPLNLYQKIVYSATRPQNEFE